MKKCYEELMELKNISAQIEKLENKNINTDGQRISFSKRKSGYQYYIYHSDGSRTYVKKNDLEIIKNMAQQEYYQDLKTAVNKQIETLEHFLANYSHDTIKNVFERRSLAKQILINPVVPTNQQYIKQWLQEHPGSQNPFPEKGKYITERGEYVRSKSEKILADLFNKHNIPYQYEPAVKLKNGRIVYPDFILLNVCKRKTYYWEHLGLVEDGEYAVKNLEKLNSYEKNGIEIGKDLIVTMETEFSTLDIKFIEEKIRAYLL